MPWQLAAAILLAGSLLAGCSSGSDSATSDGDGGGGSSDLSAVAPAEAPDDGRQASASEPEAGSAEDSAGDSGADAPAEEGRVDSAVDPADAFRRSVVRTGDLALVAEDVGKARYDVQRIADRYRGEVSEENTESDDDGEALFARMVLRVPSDDFDEAVAAVEKVGVQASVSTSADDVTTQLIDLQTRVATQRRSIARITVLFEEASGIRDVMAIEAELSRRQADLESLERQRTFLAGQSSMSTITVGIERQPEKKKAAAATTDDDDGFLAGLSAGWGALRTFGTGLATVAGALLPWLVVGAALGVPLLLLLRRRTPRVAPEGHQSSE